MPRALRVRTTFGRSRPHQPNGARLGARLAHTREEMDVMAVQARGRPFS